MEISITTTFSIDCEVQKTFNSPIIIAFAKILEKLPEDFCVQSHANVILFF